MKTLAGDERRTMSNMAAELIEKALKLPEVQAQIDAALIKVPTPDDPRASVPQRQVVNRQSYAVSPEEAEELRKARGLNMQEATDKANEAEVSMSYVPADAPEGAVADGAGGYLVPDGRGGLMEPGTTKEELDKTYAEMASGPKHASGLTAEEMQHAEELWRDGWIETHWWGQIIQPTEASPGESKKACVARDRAKKLPIIEKAEAKKAKVEQADREAAATEKRLAEQDDKLARMEQMMAQLLAAQQKG